ncbi:MAG: type II secretion system F family protein [Candidatus Thiodiazotropha sp.]
MDEKTLFGLMIFIVVLLMSQAFVAPIMGARRAARQRLRQRIRSLGETADGESHAASLRKKQLQALSRFERWLESLPMMDRLAALTSQAGLEQPAYRTLLHSALIALTTGLAAGWYMGEPLIALLLAAGAAYLPFLMLMTRRNKRLRLFEEQLPDALSVVTRSLKAGMPFSESLNMVCKEMKPPVSKEFGQVFNELNYGGDLRSALLGLLVRMPTVAVMAVVTAVLIQRETGGNLAEVLERIATLLRNRFRFQRSVRTLSAEGRGTAWVVSIMPFVLAAISELMKPGWFSSLAKDALGQQLIVVAFILMVIGIFWLKRLVNIDM